MASLAAGTALFYDEMRKDIKSINAFKVECEDAEPQIGNAMGLVDPYVFGRSVLTPISPR